MAIRRMRDIARPMPHKGERSSSRENAMNKLARLEQERGRLEATMNVWIANQRRTEQQLDQVLQHIAQLQKALGLSDAEQTARAEARSPRKETGGDEQPGWDSFVLEY